MSLTATGAYLKRLREAAGLSRLGLSKMVDTSDSQIIRIERGEETRASLLARIIKVLDANPADVNELLVSDSANSEDGIRMADLRIAVHKNNSGERIPMHQEVFLLASQMSDYDLGKWVSLGGRLVEERTRG